MQTMSPVSGSLRAQITGFLYTRGHLVVLAMVVGLALFLRLYGINWDQGGLYHPDERAILFHVEAISFPIHDLSSLFGPDSSLNPGWFPYGSLPLYLLKLTSYLAPPFLEGPSLHKLAITGRAISALFDVATVILVYAVASRLFTKWTGVLAASFIALSALHIQQSHFFVTDIMLAAWLLASFMFLIRAMEQGRLKSFALAGLFFGLALATKVSAAPMALAFVTAAVLYVWGPGRQPETRGIRMRHAGRGILAAAGVTVLAFAIAQPYGIIDYRTFLGDVGEQSEMVRRIRDFPFTRQYIDSTPYLYHVRQLAVWGMGVPAGIVIWGGLLFSVASALFRRAPKHMLLLSWVLPYFLITGSFDVKFMRYMLPITPFLAIMGGSMVTWAFGRVAQRPTTLLRPAFAYAGLAAVMLFTGFYALAYTNIYSRPHTAEAASDWINANVPSGSVFLQDSAWEEGFKHFGSYSQFRIEVYDDETPAKRQRMIEGLARADYLLFYSNRQYGSIPRLLDRYPMTRDYYTQLFNGELGYELVHFESSYPTLYGVSFADDTFGRPDLPTPGPLRGYEQTAASLNLGFADESFTVYDHPLILVFQNTLQGTEQERRAFLDSRLLQPGLRPVSGALDTSLLFSEEDARTQQQGGTWSSIFNRDSIVNKVAVIPWFLLVQLIFLVTLPITLMLFRRLPDRGYLLGKVLGILLVSYIAWLLASLHWLSFSRGSIGLGIGLVALVSAGILRSRHREMFGFLRRNKRMIITGEALFLISFLGLYAIRLWNPDLWHPIHGGEKPMDFAYFNAVVRSTYMPPYDPWFAGGQLNYYYFGQFMNATLTKFSGIIPAVAINLVVPLFFALTMAAAFSIVYNLATLARRRIRDVKATASRWIPSPIWAGLIGAILLAVIGNLDGIIQVSQGIGRVVTGDSFGPFNYWDSSRMMPSQLEGITEFPYFTFLFADPHAHLFAIPLTLLAVGLAMAIVLGARTCYPIIGRIALFPFLVLGMALGAILATNSWDVLTYSIMGGIALLIAEYSVRRRFNLAFLASSVVKIGALGAISALFFLPYISSYQVPIREGGDSFISSLPLLGTMVDGIDDTFKSSDTVTDLYRYMGIHGLFVFILFSFMALEAWRRYGASFKLPAAPTTMGFSGEAGLQAALQTLGWRWLAYIGGGAAAIGVLSATGYATVGFLLGMLLLLTPLVLGDLVIRDRGTPVRLFVYMLIALPLLLGILVDVLTFEADIGRLNTVFKFYLQAWALFALATAYALWRMRFGEAIPWIWVRRSWQTLVVLLVAASLIYPVMGTPVRARERFDTVAPSANGMTFMDTTVYTDNGAQLELKWDRDGIEWLQDNVQGSPVIVEGIAQLYRWGNRISVYTGLPAVIGWDHHQKQQRGDYVGRNSGVDQRRREVDDFFESINTVQANSFLQRYGVRYIYVGQLERAFYPEAGLAKFDSLLGDTLELAYENPQVRIYQVLQEL